MYAALILMCCAANLVRGHGCSLVCTHPGIDLLCVVGYDGGDVLEGRQHLCGGLLQLWLLVATAPQC